VVGILRKNHTRRGFSLIELLVSVGILAFISSVILANHSRFNSQLLLGNLAYDVALSVRQAQVFGLSVREFKSSTTFDTGYGVHITSSDPNTYIIFADTNKNGVYDSGSDGIADTFSVRRGFAISDICATLTGVSEICNSTGGVDSIDIVFLRPEPDANIYINGTNATRYSQGRIEVSSPSGTTRSVDVESTGQISIP